MRYGVQRGWHGNLWREESVERLGEGGDECDVEEKARAFEEACRATCGIFLDGGRGKRFEFLVMMGWNIGGEVRRGVVGPSLWLLYLA